MVSRPDAEAGARFQEERTGSEFEQPVSRPNNVLVVLGMHRSGTSALTGVLSMMGADPGASLMPADEAINPKGFWEHAEIVPIHERLLLALGSSWHDERPLPNEWWKQPLVQPFRTELMRVLQRDFAGSRLWIVKDPRIDRLIPLWLEILRSLDSNPHFVISLRHPMEVAKSLAHRDNIPEERSSLLWLQHVLDAETYTRNFPRALITFEELIADWRAAARRIDTALSLNLSRDDPEVQRRVEQFLEPSLRHHTDAGSPLGPASRLALAVYEACKRNPAQLEVVLPQFAAELARLTDTVAPWAGEIQDLWRARSDLVRELDDSRRAGAAREAELVKTVEALQAEVSRVKSTVSWRMTGPLRVAHNVWRRLIN